MAPSPHPLPRVAEFERLAYGLFLHFGLYSQFGRGEWVQHAEKLATDAYLPPLMATFTAEDFDARAWARLARRSGMRYITLTTRHHEGFSLYDTRGLSRWDVTRTPAGRDLIAEFVAGCRAEGIRPHFYHTTLDWNEPRFKNDFRGYLAYLRESVELLCRHYGEVGGFWFDGNWSKKDADWEEGALYAVIRKFQPNAIIVNNTGIEEPGRTGNPEIDAVTYERGRPEPMDRSGHARYVAGEMCHTLNYHWGTAARDFNYLSPAHVIEELCACRRAGANFLLNVGPMAQGGIPEYEGAVLRKVGDWIALHGGPTFFDATPCGVQGEGSDFGLRQGDDLWLFVHDLTATGATYASGGPPSKGPGPRRFRGVPEGYRAAAWLDSGESLTCRRDGDALVLEATGYPYGTNTVVRIARLTR